MNDQSATGGENFFCSVRSRESREDVFGTASVGTFWVLVEYAALWAPRAVEGSALPAPVKSRLLSLPQTIPRSRVLFIRAGRVGTDHFNLFVVRSRERDPSIVRFRLRSYDDILGVDFAALAAGDGPGGEAVGGPLLLVCTHGRRDKCCAKFGWPLYKSLRESLRETLRETAGGEVWQSSHVGGDRFAGNLVCFPHGLFYGHVEGAGAARVVEEYRAGRVVAEGYRGRACYSHPVQAAEYFVRRESGLRGVDDLRYLGAVKEPEASRRVTFVERGGETAHEVLVTRRESDFQNRITCHAREERRVPQYVLEEYLVRSARPRASA